jgi:hypothetical protein
VLVAVAEAPVLVLVLEALRVVVVAVELELEAWRAARAGADLTGASTANTVTRNTREVALSDIIASPFVYVGR